MSEPSPITPERTRETAAARTRIRAAYDPELVRTAGRRLMDTLGNHLAGVENREGTVLKWTDPEELTQHAGQVLEDGVNQDDPAERFDYLAKKMLEHGHNLHHPHYIGHQVPASIPMAGLFDAVGSITNQVMAVYEIGPWASSAELAMVRRLGNEIGWEKRTFSGMVTHGGSLANLTALLTARNVVLGKSWEDGLARGPAPVFVAHAESHYSVARSAGILGIGADQVVKAGLDDRRRIDPDQLETTLARLRAENRPIVAVIAGACATPIGAFDPLEDIADVCKRHDVWLHVDAAHGGSACLSKKYAHLVRGMDRGDSIVWDAHKMMFVPSLCAFVFYKNKELQFEAFRQNAPYLFDPSDPGVAEYDVGLRTVECTKRAAIYGLWGAWALFGRQLFADLVDVTFDMGRLFYEKLSEASDFEPLHEPQCNIVAFRYLPPSLSDASNEAITHFQLELRKRIVRSGRFYIVPTQKDGIGALRTVIMNPLTTPDDLDELMATLRELGQQIER